MKDLVRWFLLVKLEPLWRSASLKTARLLAAVPAGLQYLTYSAARRIIRRELARDLDFGVLRRERAVIGSIYHHLLNDVELGRFPDLDRSFLQKYVRIEGSGWRYLRNRRGQSAILATFHFGPNQVVIPVFPLLGFPFNQLGVAPSHWDDLIGAGPKLREVNLHRTRRLEAAPARFIYLSEGNDALREAFAAVRRGELLCLAADGRLGRHRRFPFLQTGMEVALGCFSLARRCSIPLIPVVVFRDRRGYLIETGEPCFIDERNEKDTVARCLAFFAGAVRRRPSQYGWTYYAKAVGG